MIARAARVLLVAMGAVGFWMALDLFGRVELPGASWLQHAAFRGVTDALQWLDVDRSRVAPTVAVAVVFVVLAMLLGRRGAPLQRMVAIAFCGPVVVAMVVASLMERPAFFGWLLGTVVLAWRGRLFGTPRSDRRVSLVSGAIGLAGATVAAVYLFQVVAADSSGYSMPDLLRAYERHGVRPRTLFLVVCAVLAVPAIWISLRRGPKDVGFALSAAAIAAGATADAWATLSTVVAAVTAVSMTAATGPMLLSPARSEPWETRRWPGASLLPGSVAVLLLAHAYSARLFACPETLAEGLTKLADPGEVFSVSLAAGGDALVLSLRNERRLGRIVDPAGDGPWTIEPTEPGPIPAPPDDPSARPGETYGTVEELVAAPELDTHFATVLAGHHDFYSMPNSPPNTVNNMVIRVRGDGKQAISTFWQEHLCWIGTLSWDAPARRMYIGCEYAPELHRFDPNTGTIDASNSDARLGDVSAVAVDAAKNRLYTVSLWDSDRVFELDRSSLRVLRSTRIGGTHYALTYDSDAGRLFAPSFYGSRVRVVDTDGLALVDRIPAGLGARAVRHVPGERDLLLVASVYDDVLRACDADTGEPMKAVRVGGHVKSIAVDSQRRLAYFWSQCGLFRLDLKVLSTSD